MGLLDLFRFKVEKELILNEKTSMINNMDRGYLVLIGGSEDKREDKIILRYITRLKPTRTISVIPTASDYPTGLFDAYFYAFKDIGIENVFKIDIRNREDTENPEYLANLEASDLIFFTGGDQVKLVNILKDSKVLNILEKKFNSGTTLVGTSAGAAACADIMIYDGDNYGLYKGTVKNEKGFGFLKNITIDTHFENRGRLGRLSQFLAIGLNKRGLGIAENTAMVINSAMIGEVIGEGLVVAVSTENLNYSNYHLINENDPVVLGGINVSFLQSGTIFNLTTWTIEASEKSDYFVNKSEEKINVNVN